MKLDDMKEKIDDWFESPAGQEYFNIIAEKHKILNQRHKRFEEWLKNNDFDKLMYRLINEHNDDYIDNCYHNGYQPYPNNKLNFVIGYVTKDDVPHPINVKEIKSDFPNEIWEFNDYYFQLIYGQGTLIRIYNKADMRLLLQL
jgi:hypothetical protein